MWYCRQTVLCQAYSNIFLSPFPRGLEIKKKKKSGRQHRIMLKRRTGVRMPGFELSKTLDSLVPQFPDV